MYLIATFWVTWSVTRKAVLTVQMEAANPTPPRSRQNNESADPNVEWLMKFIITVVVTFTATDATRIAVGAKPYLLMIVGGASILIMYLPRILCECYYRTLNRNVVCAAAMAQITADILAFATKATIKTFRVFVDTGCSISIINDKSRLVNVKKIRPITVNGIAGAREINMAGDLMLRVVDNEGVNRTIVVNNVLFDPDSPVNLLSSDQLRRAGIATRIETKDEDCCIVLNTGGEPIVFPLQCEKRIFSLYTVDAEEYDSIKPDEMVNVMGLFSGNISLEELMHRRMNHVNDDKTVEQSHRVDGIPRILRRLKMFKGPCNCCQDAKSKRNDYPPSTETWADGPDRWNFDMFDMGENFKTIHGHRYCTMVVIHKSRFAMIFLHSD